MSSTTDIALIAAIGIGGFLIYQNFWGGGLGTPDPNAPGQPGLIVNPDPNGSSPLPEGSSVLIPNSEATGLLAPFYSAGWDYMGQVRVNTPIPDTGNAIVDVGNDILQAIPGLAQINTAGYNFSKWLGGVA